MLNISNRILLEAVKIVVGLVVATGCMVDKLSPSSRSAFDGVVDTDGNPVSDATEIGDIDTIESTVGELKNLIAPDYATVSNLAVHSIQEHQSLANYYTKGEVDEAISEIDLPKPGYSWVRPGEWAINVELETDVTFDRTSYREDWEDECGRIWGYGWFTNVIGMAARCTPVLLDESSMDLPNVVQWESVNGGDITADGYFSATNPGLYRIAAHDSDGSTRFAEIALSGTHEVVYTNYVYYADSSNTVRKAINDAGYEIISDAQFVVSNKYNSGYYMVYDTFTPKFAPPGNGHFAHWAVSPHVTCSATHYPSHPLCQQSFSDGGVSVTVQEKYWVNLKEWALTNGFSATEASYVDDMTFFVCDGSSAIPDGCIPRFLSEESHALLFDGDLKSTQGWASVQDFQYAVPLTLYGAYGNVVAVGGRNFFGLNGWTREDLAELMDSHRPNYPVHVGDSGRPIFFLLNGEPVVTAHFTTTVGTPANYIKGFKIIKAFVESVGDTLKAVEVQ